MKKLLLLIFAVAIVAGALVWSFSRGKPDDVIQKMIAAMSEVRSLHFAIQTDLEGSVPITSPFPIPIPSDSSEMATVAITAEGDADTSTPGFSLFQSIFTITAKDEKQSSEFGLELRLRDKKIYVRLTKAPSEGIDLSRVINQWTVIDPEVAGTQFGLEKGKEKKQPLREEQINRIRELVRNTKFFSLERVLPSEKIAGTATFHYAVTLNLPETRSFAIESRTIATGKEATAKELAELDTTIEKLDEITGELWIGRRDYLLYQVMLQGITPSAESGANATWQLTATLTNHNQPVAVEVPEESTPFEQFLGLLLGGSLGLPAALDRGVESTSAATATLQFPTPTFTPGSSENTDSDGDGLIDSLETFYGSDPSNPDTDGDGVNDGAEVQAGQSPTGPGGLYEFGIGR